MISKYPKERKEHWESIYTKKSSDEVSWYQERPETSLAWIKELSPGPDSEILDVGGGDSRLPDVLLESGYKKITVLDISGNALMRSKARMGEKAQFISWVEGDVVEFTLQFQVDVWHDRAAFHFLTENEDIAQYVKRIKDGVKEGGHAIIATFSKEGPKKCSGIEIRQYTSEELSALLSPEFELVKSETLDHATPSGSEQNFLFTAFRRISLG